MPAALAAISPAWLSSNTSASAGSTASARAASRKPSGSGLVLLTASPPMRARRSMQSSTPSLSRNESITERGLDDTTPSFRLRAAAARTASGAPGIGFTSVATSFQCASRSAAITVAGAVDLRAFADPLGDVDPGPALRIGVRQPEVRESVLREDAADRLVRVDFAVDQRAVEVEEHCAHWSGPGHFAHPRMPADAITDLPIAFRRAQTSRDCPVRDALHHSA